MEVGEEVDGVVEVEDAGDTDGAGEIICAVACAMVVMLLEVRVRGL
jgi:hypothetical protein